MRDFFERLVSGKMALRREVRAEEKEPIHSRRSLLLAFGGIGCNGAQRTPEAIQAELPDAGGRCSFAARKLYNLKSHAFIGDPMCVGGRLAAAILAAVAVAWREAQN